MLRQTQTLCKLLDILYSMLGFFWHTFSSLSTKLIPLFGGGGKTALNDLFHSNSAFSELTKLLSVDSLDES